MLQQALRRGALVEGRARERRKGGLHAIRRRRGLGQQQLCGAESVQLRARDLRWELGAGELTGGDVHVGQAHLAVARGQGSEVVVRPPLEQVVLHERARGDDAHHLALHQPLALARLLYLLADGDLVAFSDELSQVRIEGMMGNAGQGNSLVLPHGPRGEDDIQLAGDGLGVIVERLVEVTEAEE